MASANTLEYLVILVWFVLFVGLTFAEGVWLNRQGWAGMAKAISFSAVTNLIGFMAGGVVVFITFLLMLMMTFDKKMSSALGGEGGIIVLLIAGVVTGPLVLTLSKRLFLRIFKMRTGSSAWIFSVVSSVVVVLITVLVPTAVAYVLFGGGAPKH
jgi:hypothetical protein